MTEGSAAPDLLVVGGGVIGLSCAWRLAGRGLRVRVLEAEQCGSGSTSAALGALVPSVSTRQNALTALQRESLLLYPRFCDELASFGDRRLYERRGRLELLRSEGRRENALHEVKLSNELWDTVDGAPAQEVISGEALAALEPKLRSVEHGAIHCRLSAQVDVGALVGALRRACEASGVIIDEGVAVGDVVIEAGVARGVRVGDHIEEAGAVLVAAGAHSGQLPAVELATRTEPARGQSIQLRVAAPLFDHLIREGSIYLLRRDDRNVVVGATTEHEAGYDRSTTDAGRELLYNGAVSLIPELADAEFVAHRAGLRPSAVDLRPYLGKVPDVHGLYSATGHYKIGIAMAPITAQVVSQLIVDGVCDHDLEPFAPGAG